MNWILEKKFYYNGKTEWIVYGKDFNSWGIFEYKNLLSSIIGGIFRVRYIG